MKKLLTIILTLIITVSSAMLLACDENNSMIKNVFVDENSHLIVEFVDGTTQDFGETEVQQTPEKAITKTEVNADKHLIVTYSDGTTEDLGYVGVEVEKEVIKEVEKEVLPPLYTVTFVDLNGNVIDTQQVYKGLSAKAPTAPQVQDKVFSGWSADITNIQGNITVSPVYGNMASYIVTFKDELGNVLKTQEVIIGKSATAPTPPTREDTIFDCWDKSYSNITSDTVVTAVYRQKKNCTVTFKDYSGILLGTVSVKEGGNATAPVTPSREGYAFKGWSGSLNNITSNTTLTAQYTINSANNIFDIAYKVNGNNVTVTLSLSGTVCLAGFEGALSFEGMTVVNAESKSSNLTCNKNGNSVKMTYSNATNVTKGEVVLEVTLTKTADNGKAILNIADCFNQDFQAVDYKVIGQDIKLK